MLIILLVTLSISSLTSCLTCGYKNEGFIIPVADDDGEEELQMSPELMGEMVDNISSPIEMASLVKSLELAFSQKYLASTRNVSRYHTSHQKAFALGIFVCDLGYLNMYGRVSLVLDYLSAVKTLADGINIGQFFDFSTLKRIATNNQNVDSLVHISQQNFNRMDKHLQQNRRGDLSILMIAGGWLEGLYLSCQFLKERPEERRLAESIGEQKTMLSQLLLMLNSYSKERYIADLITELNTIKVIFDDIRITIEVGEPSMVEVNGMWTFTSGETSIVHYTDEQMEEITKRTEIVRNKLIN